MPILTNARHERFAQALAAGKSADEAYQDAGYAPNRGNAATLKANQSVRARVAELQEKTAKKAGVTVESLTAMLIEDREGARAAAQFAAAVSAVDKLAKLHGHMIDRKEIRTGQILTDDELDARINDLAGSLGVEAGTGGALGGEAPPGRTH